MNNQELLNRIEKLEQAIQDIWAACSCLQKDDEMGEFNCDPTCEDCGQFNCSCEPKEIEEGEEYE